MNRIKELRRLYDTKQEELAKQLEISQGTLSGWENEKYEPDLKSINNMCDIFHVSTDFLLGRENFIRCKVCHNFYNPLDKAQTKEHEEYHDRFTKAQSKFGEIIPYGDAQERRDKCIDVFRNNLLPLKERIDAYDNYLKYSFMIDMYKKNFNLDHEEFNEFTAKEIINLQPDTVISEELCNKVRQKYGINADLPEVTLTTKDERDIAKDVQSLMEKLSNKEYGPAAYEGEDIPEEDAELFAGQLELMLRRLKVINKEKYNPNKNKK